MAVYTLASPNHLRRFPFVVGAGFKTGDLIMKNLKMALALACAFASTSATASVLEKQSENATSAVSTCYYEYTILTADAIYDVYTCYSNGDGSW